MCIRVAICLCFVFGFLGRLHAAEATPEKLEMHQVELKLIEHTNATRARYGLPPLAISNDLMQTARSHTAWMCNSNTLAHTSRPVAENIAMGQTSVEQAITDWMNSPGHRANMLSARYSKIGVGAYRSASGTVYWCQQFIW